jgi:eukaryotic-like serine/threonine-protein kinase
MEVALQLGITSTETKRALMADPQTAKTIFLAAIEKPPFERAALLDEATAGDPSLRARVEALLKAHDSPESFLDQPALAFPATAGLPATAFEAAGSTIGPYKLLEQIGEGGMGVVYMADQQSPVRRRVALKIIKAGMDTRQVIARFEAERQALALMDHSNIARVLDAGATDSGRPYFVMELVRGIPITEYCDQNNLPVHERIELFVLVCHAVQHAHQKGIIHRDLKPTNVLVTLHDGRAVPKVIDFGVSKATGQQLTDKTLFTAFAQMVGTPLYMSPEQAEMTSNDVDTRSDIYSLGVLLYELLTGTTPFDQQRMRAAAFDEVRRIIREEEPPKPSTRLSTLGESRAATAAHRQVDLHRLGRLLKGDLDWIVMKALDKDRTRRYDTAGNFAADVLRHLSDLPVEACPPSAVYRFRKFARRNRGAILVASVAMATLLFLVIGLAVTNRLIVAERNEKTIALADKEEALAFAKSETRRAEENFIRASSAIREILTKAAMGLDEWSDLPLPLRQRLSDEAIKFYERLIQEPSPNPNRRYEVAIGLRTIGTLLDYAGERQESEESLQRSITILDQLVQEHPAIPQYRHQLAWSHVWLSRLLVADTKRRSDARAAGQRAYQLYEVLVAEASDLKPNGIATIPVSRAENDGLDKAHQLSRLLTCCVDLFKLESAAGRFPDAEKWYRRTVEVLASQSMSLPTGLRSDLGHALRMYAFLLRRAGRLEEAEKVLGEALAMFTQAMSNQPHNAMYWHFTADTERQIAELMIRSERHEQAEQALRRSIEVHEQGAAKLPIYAVNEAERATSYKNMASLLATSPIIWQRKPAQAVEFAKKAVEIRPTSGGCWNTLGVALYRAGEWAPAADALSKSMELRDGGDASDWFFLAMAHWQLDQKDAARSWYDKAVEWTDENQSQNEELRRFRAEAAELLGISKPQSTADKQPFNDQ